MTTDVVIDASTADVPHAGRRLQLTRAAQWFAGGQGDPLAQLLRGTSEPDAAERIRAEGPLRHSPLLDAWATADPAVVAAVLTGPAFDGLTTDGARPRGAELPLAGPALTVDRATAARLGDLVRPGGNRVRSATEDDLAAAARAHVEQALDDAGHLPVDLAAVARAAVAALLMDELGVADVDRDEVAGAIGRTETAVDGTLVPAVLDDARACYTAQQRLNFLFTRPDEGRDSGRAALMLAVAAAEPAVAMLIAAVEGSTRPPVRLEVRVTVEDTTLAGVDLPTGSDVVLLMDDVEDVAPDLWLAPAAPLLRAFVRGGRAALTARLPDLGPSPSAVRRPRSPVVGAFATYPPSSEKE